MPALEPPSGRPRLLARADAWAPDVTWLVPPALVLLAYGFGVYAWAQDGPRGIDWHEAAYRAVQLFAMNSGEAKANGPGKLLEVARWLAPGIGATAAALALLIVFRRRARVLHVRLRYRGHVVVAGIGAKGFELARAFHEDRRVVVIDRDGTGSHVESCHDRGIPVVIGDATDQAVLARAAVQRAALLVVTCGADTVNVRVALEARALAKREARCGHVLTHLDDLTLWRALALWDIRQAAPAQRTPLSFFNLFDLAAIRLLDQHPPDSLGGADGPPHVAVVGSGPLLESVVGHLMRRCEAAAEPGAAPARLTVAGPISDRWLCAVDDGRPGGGATCRVEAVAADDPAVAAADMVYVLLRDEAAGLALALRLADDPTSAADVVLVVADERAGVARVLETRPAGARQVSAFGVYTASLTADLERHSPVEMLAYAKHRDYLTHERARGVTAAENPSAVPWEALPPERRQPNRDFASRVAQTLGEHGYALVVARFADRGPPFAFTESQIEALARSEHELWCRDMRAAGFDYGPVKDYERRRHPLLRDWSALSEEAREKDRDPFRTLPSMLAPVGLQVHQILAPDAPPEAAPPATVHVSG